MDVEGGSTGTTSDLAASASAAEEEAKKNENNNNNQFGVPEEGTIVEEGTAKVIFQGDVFYNPVQVFNRDLSVHVIKLFAKILEEERELVRTKRSKRTKKLHKSDMGTVMNEMITPSTTAEGKKEVKKSSDTRGLRILEALSATGLRSIRYVKEIPNIKLCVANDLSADAVRAIERNVRFNEVSPKVLRASNRDAISLMHESKNEVAGFDVVDLDPYGAPGIFLDSAVQAVRHGGLLCVTCTDMQNLSGVNPEACFMKYGAVPIKPARYVHEMALRICLGTINIHAARYGRFIVPLLSVSSDFYIRVFVRVYVGSDVRLAGTKLSHVYQSSGNDSFFLEPTMVVKNPKSMTVKPGTHGHRKDDFEEFYGYSHKIGGPVWNAPIHDFDFVSLLLKSVGKTEPKVATYPGAPLGRRWKKLNGVLTAVRAEKECGDCPLYYSVSAICSTLRCSAPSRSQMFSVIRREGYRVTGSHCNGDAIKTNAPNRVIWDIMRSWVKLHPVSKKRLEKDSPCSRILLAKEPSKTHSFAVDHSVAKERNRGGATPFLPNPEKFWGPKSRAKKKRPISEVPATADGEKTTTKTAVGTSEPAKKKATTEGRGGNGDAGRV
eukprot:g4826.t1